MKRATPPNGPTTRRFQTCALACVLGSSLLTGCALPQYRPGKRLADQCSLPTYMALLRNRNPDQCRLTQRILLRVGRRDLDMTGYLYLQPGDAWVALALGDMGMELFRLRFDDNGGEVIKKPDSMPANPLRNGIIRDIQHLFGWESASNTYLVERRNAETGLVLEHGDGSLEEYGFAKGGSAPVRSMGVSNRRIVREAVYSSPMKHPGIEHPLPGRIVLRNHKWRYTMEIVLLQVRAAR